MGKMPTKRSLASLEEASNRARIRYDKADSQFTLARWEHESAVLELDAAKRSYTRALRRESAEFKRLKVK
jgi:hypothetical protein